MGKKLLERFTKKICKKRIKKKKNRIEKEIKREGGKLYVKWKDIIICWIAG